MSVSRVAYVTKIGVEQMGDLADSLKDLDVLRLENLDTDLRPPQSALEFTKRAVDDDEANSYLPFLGLDALRQAAADLVGRNDPTDGIRSSVAEWQRRRDVLLEELREFHAIPPHGGWSLLLDVSHLRVDAGTASKRLLQLGKIAATPMVNWGSPNSDRYVRFVFANEPVDRLRGIAEHVKQALT